MSGRITLITPPDIYENSNVGVLFAHISDEDQELVSKWLADKELENDLNFYIYNGESDVPWFFWAVGCCQYKYIDLDGVNEISTLLGGYVLSKPGFYYKTDNENTAAVASHINNNRISSIEKFLERILSEQNS
jgi:hypothetical protein